MNRVYTSIKKERKGYSEKKIPHDLNLIKRKKKKKEKAVELFEYPF